MGGNGSGRRRGEEGVLVGRSGHVWLHGAVETDRGYTIEARAMHALYVPCDGKADTHMKVAM